VKRPVSETQSVAGQWTGLIDDLTSGHWRSPDTGAVVDVPFRNIKISPDMAEGAADLLFPAMPAESYAVVCDEATAQAMGERVVRELGAKATLVILDHPHADEGQVAALQKRTEKAEALVAVGSGTINDLCKFATYLDGRNYAVFATAPSMNGYTSSTASITLHSGLKTTQKAHAAKGVFIDIGVSANAPQYLIGAGLGDCLCRPTAQIDWYFSHMMFGTHYATTPYVLQECDEAETLERSSGLGSRDHDAIGYLQRLLTLGGLGIAIVGMSHPGSMGEHQISHWIDSFAGERHPGTVHGQQVGIASITMARLQDRILSMEEAPKVKPYIPDEAEISRRYPAAAVEDCLAACRTKAMDEAATARFNGKLEEIWPSLRYTLKSMALGADAMVTHLRASGGGTTWQEIGMDRDLYVEALRRCPEIRGRYSLLDLAIGMGILDDFIAECV
jgi:glycerol-1-phosphate dehydrogenase [NAD(P)+]